MSEPYRRRNGERYPFKGFLDGVKSAREERAPRKPRRLTRDELDVAEERAERSVMGLLSQAMDLLATAHWELERLENMRRDRQVSEGLRAKREYDER